MLHFIDIVMLHYYAAVYLYPLLAISDLQSVNVTKYF